MLVKVHLVDAFTEQPGQGNRAGVVLDAQGLTDGQMQEIARQVNVSETAFVLPPEDNTHQVKVRYFTPTKEVPICGHATIATHYLRARQEHATMPQTVLSKTGVGVLPVDIVADASAAIWVIMTQSTPILEAPFNRAAAEKIAEALGINITELEETLPLQIASTGHPKIMIPLKSKQTLDRITPDFEKLKNVSRELQCNGFYVFTLNTQRKDIKVAGRMFAPAIGIQEDPVTGNANGPAGYYLYMHNRLDKGATVITYTALQGEAMGKPGLVEVILRINSSNENAILVQVKGRAVLAGEMHFHVNGSDIEPYKAA